MPDIAWQTYASKEEFREKLAFGQIGESVLALWLRRFKQYTLLPVYEKEIDDGKGQRVFTPTTQLVAPDFLAMRAGDVLWFEAKHKSVWTWHKKTGTWETGINLHHAKQYCDVVETTTFPVYLLFLHEKDRLTPDDPLYHDPRYAEDKRHYPCPTGLFYCGLTKDTLTNPALHSHIWEKTRPHMIYWNVRQLRKIATLEEVRVAARMGSLN